MPPDVLAGLDPEQRAAAEAVRGPVCILAGAGTGKTRAITHRIAYAVSTGAVPAAQLLAVTFTTRAASEMRHRLRALGVDGVQARTFHSAALRQLQYFWPRIVGGGPPQVVASKIALVRAAAARCQLSLGAAELRDVTSELEWAKSVLVPAEDYPAAARTAGREPPVDEAVVARISAAYDEVKRDRGQVDFEDLLLLTAAAIEDHRDVAAEVRARYRHFVVDEYQDVSPLQQRVLDAWLGDREDLCVVGDANQTIYSFAGASPGFLTGFRARYPTATEIRLVRDYRSTPQVVALANAVLAPGRDRLELVAQRAAGPEPAFTAYDDEPAEAAGVAARCQELIARGAAPRDIAVLYRVNAQSEAFEQALAAISIPYLIRGGERFFDRPEIRQAVVLLRGAARSANADEASGLTESVTHVLAAAGWAPEPPAGSGAVRERWEALHALVTLAGELPEGTELTGFVAELEDRAAAQHAPPVEGVTLASLHAAKGLEWDTVFLVGLVEGMVPISHAVTAAQLEEERRLLYVGITRARSALFLSWALARSPGGRRVRQRSRFLDGLRPATRTRAADGAAKAGRSRRSPVRCRVCGKPIVTGPERALGRCARCPSAPDAALFDRLRSWRTDRARALGQPAYCVFTDATLTAIADSRPRTLAALGALPGIGSRKLATYGGEVLALVDATR